MIDAIIADYTGRSVQSYDILDIGAGNGDISEFFQNKNNQFAIDIYDFRNQKISIINFIIGVSENLPCKKNSFDIVLSHHVIEHVRDQLKHLQEINRVLKPGGLCYIATPNRTSPFMAGHKGNNQVLCHNMLVALIKESGFKPIEYYSKIIKSPNKYHYPVKFGKFIPISLIKQLKRYFPSQCFIIVPDKHHNKCLFSEI